MAQWTVLSRRALVGGAVLGAVCVGLWAVVPGVWGENLHPVIDGRVYRSGRLSPDRRRWAGDPERTVGSDVRAGQGYQPELGAVAAADVAAPRTTTSYLRFLDGGDEVEHCPLPVGEQHQRVVGGEERVRNAGEAW